MSTEGLNEAFNSVLSAHCRDVMRFLQTQELSFSFVCELKQISFEPPLPESIRQNLAAFSRFIITGFTFSTLDIGADSISFLAGFGPDNYASNVSVAISGVLEIRLMNERILFVRPHGIDLFAEKGSLPDVSKADSMPERADSTSKIQESKPRVRRSAKKTLSKVRKDNERYLSDTELDAFVDDLNASLQAILQNKYNRDKF